MVSTEAMWWATKEKVLDNLKRARRISFMKKNQREKAVAFLHSGGRFIGNP